MLSRVTSEMRTGSRAEKLASGVPLLLVVLVTLISPIIYDLLSAVISVPGS